MLSGCAYSDKFQMGGHTYQGRGIFGFEFSQEVFSVGVYGGDTYKKFGSDLVIGKSL